MSVTWAKISLGTLAPVLSHSRYHFTIAHMFRSESNLEAFPVNIVIAQHTGSCDVKPINVVVLCSTDVGDLLQLCRSRLQGGSEYTVHV